MYGHKYKDQISETLRTTVEHCDCLQSFFLLHSMGGGEGEHHLTVLFDAHYCRYWIWSGH